MGCNVREKHIRANRRVRSVKPDPEQGSNSSEKSVLSKSVMDSGVKPLNYFMGSGELGHGSGPTPNLFDENGWGYCTEEQLEGILMKNLEFLYNEAIMKLVSCGYEEDVAMKAVLKNGHCYGGMDVMTNILHNALAYISSGTCTVPEEPENNFTELRQMQEYSLAGMVCLLQQVRPHLSKGDAMWCLLMSDLHLGRASALDIPGLPQGSANGNGNSSTNGGGSAPVVGCGNVESVVNGPVGIPPAICSFHGGWGFTKNGPDGSSGFLFGSPDAYSQKEIDCPSRFGLTPPMKTLLKKNVAAFAAGFKANSKYSFTPSSLSGSGGEGVVAKAEEPQNSKARDIVSSVLAKFHDLNLDEATESGRSKLDEKDEMILSLVQQIKDLDRQVKERKEWAHQKAMQAARKLSSDLTELKMLRIEREENQDVKKGKQTLEDSTMKRLTEMENALRKASGEVDRANSAVKKLEAENAELRAEMEACKLSASESVATFMEIGKRERKHLKKLSASLKQKSKLQEEIAAKKQMIATIDEQIAQVEAAQKEAQEKWFEEEKAKEQAATQVEEERRFKEAAEASSKRKLEALRLKIEIDFQRQKDDLQRLEQDLSRLKSSEKTSAQLHQRSAPITSGHSGNIARLLRELDNLESSEEKDVAFDRKCMICCNEEVSVVFLPCAHQVLCANCNESYGKKGRAACPCCRVAIEHRIRVFGATS